MDTISAPMFTLLTVLYVLLMAALLVIMLYSAVAGWASRRELRRASAAEADALAELRECLTQLADQPPPQPFYPPIGPLPRPPSLPTIYEVMDITHDISQAFGVPPTYPGDLAEDEEPYPLWEQEFDAIVLARTGGEW